MLRYSPLLKQACVIQVVLDKWFLLSQARQHTRMRQTEQGPGASHFLPGNAPAPIPSSLSDGRGIPSSSEISPSSGSRPEKKATCTRSCYPLACGGVSACVRGCAWGSALGRRAQGTTLREPGGARAARWGAQRPHCTRGPAKLVTPADSWILGGQF